MVFMRMIVLALAAFCCLTDLKQNRILNTALVVGASIGLCCRFTMIGIYTLPYCIAGGLVALIPGAFLFRYRMIGAGDVKLLTVIGCIIGFSAQCRFLIWTFLFAGMEAAWLLYKNGNLKERVEYLKEWSDQRFVKGEKVAYRKEEGAENFHLTVPILASAILYAAAML